jgi:hypothetical protein
LTKVAQDRFHPVQALLRVLVRQRASAFTCADDPIGIDGQRHEFDRRGEAGSKYAACDGKIGEKFDRVYGRPQSLNPLEQLAGAPPSSMLLRRAKT